MSLQFIFYLLFFLQHLYFTSAYQLKIRMPDVSPKTKEAYLCTFERLPRRVTYAVKFEALADKHTAHHILVYACYTPRHRKSYWECENSGVCSGEGKILFAWAKNAPPFELPNRVAFELNSDEYRYVGIQIHYARPLQDGETDSSGVAITLTTTEQHYLAGVYLFETSNFKIPPKARGYHADITCLYRGHSIAPFAFRTHSHARGRVISAYRIREGEWHLIGKGNPQEPQAFFLRPQDDKIVIHNGDRVAARCTFDSNASDIIYPGSYSTDEMCNFYMMYYAKPDYIEDIDEGCHRRTAQLDFPAETDVPVSNMIQISSTPPSTTATLTSTTTSTASKASSSSSSSTTTSKEKPKATNPLKQKATEKSTLKSTKKAKTEGFHPTIEKEEEPFKPVLSEKQLDSNIKFGQISGVSVKSDGTVVVFHRGDRKWDYNSFDDDDVFLGSSPIHQHTIIGIHSVTGNVMYAFGKDMFYMPHGLTIDHNDDYWITDVAMHQVFKFSGRNFSQLLELGQRFKPGKSDDHFCKPTDVAVARDGTFFVADGYCNSRVLKFSSDGQLVTKWGKRTTGSHPGPGEFDTPHSLSLDHEHNHIYIADRENGRIQKYTTDGQFINIIQPEGRGGRLFAVAYGHIEEDILYAVSGPSQHDPSGFTISAKDGKVMNKWNTREALKQPHDVALSKDNKHMFVVEIGPNRLWKFDIHNKKEDQTQNFPWKPISKVQGKELDIEDPSQIEEDDPTLVPAVIIVVILALPLILIIIGVLTHHVRFKRKRNRAVRNFHTETLNEIRNELCFGCFVTREYKYDLDKYDNDFEKLIKGEIVVDEEDEELFTRKA